MKLGTQYYRDPHPPETFWRKDLAAIARAGFSVIGCYIQWRYVNPEPDRWELDKHRRLFAGRIASEMTPPAIDLLW